MFISRIAETSPKSLKAVFGKKAIVAIEKAMLKCNKISVYVEQYRDICESGVAWEVFDDLIKKYLYVRRKILNLERSWEKYMPGSSSAPIVRPS